MRRLYDILKNKCKLSEAVAKEIVADGAMDNEKTDKVLNAKIDNRFKDLKDIFLTKDDKIDLLNKMGAHFKWLVGVMLTAISLVVVLSKLI